MRIARTMIDCKTNRRLVGKTYKPNIKTTTGSTSSRYRGGKGVVIRDVQMQTIAKLLAKKFSLEDPPVPTAVDFIFTCCYELVNRDENDVLRWIGMEPYIEGDYQKYNKGSLW